MTKNPITARLTLGKTERLKSRKVIEELFSKGKSFTVSPIRVLYLFSDKETTLRSGFTVSSKNFKKAVERNRIKRLLREVYRLQKNELANNIELKKKDLSVFFIYTGNTLPEYHLLFKVMTNALLRLNKIVDEDVSPDP